MHPSLPVLMLWLHLLGVIVWIGSLLVHTLVLIPGLQRLTPLPERLRLMLSLEARFRRVMWPVVGVVLFTGLVNVMRIFSGTVLAGEGLPARFVQVLSLKLLLVLGMVLLQAVQQFVVQPRRLAWLTRLDPALQDYPAELAQLQRLTAVVSVTTLAMGAGAVLLALLLRGL